MALHRVELKRGADLQGFRQAMRRLLAEHVRPQDVLWSADAMPVLFGTEDAGGAPPVLLPRAVANLIELVVCHSDPERHALLYTLVWRVVRGERALLEIGSDPLVHRLEAMRKAVRRDLHGMHAFLRFRRVEDADGAERFVAWFEPEHDILRASAGFFVARFRGLVWSILTPIGSLHWDRERLAVGPPAVRRDAPDGDPFEAGWRGYYESAFNPARANPKAMRARMPKKYWRNMPETPSIPHLVRSAPARVVEMIGQEAAPTRKRKPEKALAVMFGQEPKTPLSSRQS